MTGTSTFYSLPASLNSSPHGPSTTNVIKEQFLGGSWHLMQPSAAIVSTDAVDLEAIGTGVALHDDAYLRAEGNAEPLIPGALPKWC